MQKKDLQALIDGYLNGSLTDASLDQLHDLLAAGDNKEAVIALLQAMIEDTPSSAGYDPANWSGMRQRITAVDKPVSAIPVSVIHRIHFLKTRWFRYVATWVIAFCLTIPFLYNAIRNRDERSAALTDLPPGGYRATLRLASGKTIRLNQAANGYLAHEGNIRIVKQQDGRLQFLVDQHHRSAAIPGENTITTPKGGQYEVCLPDGSRVWLNAFSVLRFPTAFDGNYRTVYLSGEAYLEVAKDASRPFRVAVGQTTIEVLGTHFNINAYPEQGSVHTTLLEGKVRVKTASGQAMLMPGQQAVSRASDLAISRAADPQEAIAWKNGFFRFSGTDIRTVLQQVARWYEVNVVYGQEVGAVHLSGEVPRSFTLQQVLKVLQESGVQLQLRHRTIYVSAPR